MALPGFTATNSLAPQAAIYHGGASFSLDGTGLVEPQFLGPIGEAFESAWESIKQAVSGAVMTLAQAASNVISSLQKSGGPGGSPFVCGQWVSAVISCTNGRPTYNEAQMMARCLSTNLGQTAACVAASAAIYPLVRQACAEGSPMGNLLGQVCHN